MGENTKIEWCSHTFNPYRGCTKISAGCANCYAETMSHRNPATLGIWGDNGTRVVASESMWKQPLKWNKEAAQAGERRRVFCASLADVGEVLPQGHRNEADIEQARRRLARLIADTPNLDWLLLTKRIAGFATLWPEWRDGWPENVWVGTSVENQEQANKRIPELLKVPAAVRFLSMEPLLGAVDLRTVGELSHDTLLGWKPAHGNFPEGCNTARVDWVIVGGESGANARPMHPDWVRSIRDQCTAAGVPFFFKQWGNWAIENMSDEHAAVPHSKRWAFDDDLTMVNVGKGNAGRELDGREWSEFPQRTITY